MQHRLKSPRGAAGAQVPPAQLLRQLLAVAHRAVSAAHPRLRREAPAALACALKRSAACRCRASSCPWETTSVQGDCRSSAAEDISRPARPPAAGSISHLRSRADAVSCDAGSPVDCSRCGRRGKHRGQASRQPQGHPPRLPRGSSWFDTDSESLHHLPCALPVPGEAYQFVIVHRDRLARGRRTSDLGRGVPHSYERRGGVEV